MPKHRTLEEEAAIIDCISAYRERILEMKIFKKLEKLQNNLQRMSEKQTKIYTTVL